MSNQQPRLSKRQRLLKEQLLAYDCRSPSSLVTVMIAKKLFRKTRPGKAANYKSLEDLVCYLTDKTEELRADNHRLSVDLAVARRKIIDLMDMRGLLDGYVGIDNYDDLLAWQRGALQRVLDAADVREGVKMGDLYGRDRALCPLCRRSANGPNSVRGFIFPEGLRRHLLGYHNAAQCDVFGAAHDSIVRRIRAKRLGLSAA
ncbi:hypothetical protein [Paraburkholderia ferrariae]|uniref:Uncharacterized protein n=1 Tax=Paraburkholderia ferrariae TaxID=386056 RepID=A0ABU9RIT3_9BURK